MIDERKGEAERRKREERMKELRSADFNGISSFLNHDEMHEIYLPIPTTTPLLLLLLDFLLFITYKY